MIGDRLKDKYPKLNNAIKNDDYRAQIRSSIAHSGYYFVGNDHNKEFCLVIDAIDDRSPWWIVGGSHGLVSCNWSEGRPCVGEFDDFLAFSDER